MLVFGINTAVNAQSRLIFTDNETGETIEHYSETTFSKEKVAAFKTQARNSTNNAATHPGSFTWTYLEWNRDFGRWDYAYGDFYFDKGVTFTQIINEIIRVFF